MTTQDPPAAGRALPDRRAMDEAVRAAQEKLLELRRLNGVDGRGRTLITNYELRITNEEISPSPLRLCPPSRSLRQPLSHHSSFHSEPLTHHLRAAAERRKRHEAADNREWLNKLRATSDELRVQSEEDRKQSSQWANDSSLRLSPSLRSLREPLPLNSSLVRVFPDIALGILRRKKAAPGRVWLLLRHHDAEGRGRIATTTAARLLTGDGSPLRICGRRQLANLLAAGDGLFWQRETGRAGDEYIRLNSAARVAAGLGVARLGGLPVAVPLGALTGRIGDVRAHLYATFHSGRTRHDLLTGGKQARGPIARSTLCKLSGAVPNSQRNYERRARVGRKSAVAIGPAIGLADERADEHETAWRRGRALFHLRDRRGRYGRPGAVYLAWQLPNEYTGPHATLPRGRQKRLNRALADLFHDGMTGNGEQNRGAVGSGQWAVGSRSVSSGSVGQPSAVAQSRRFYGTAKAAFLARGNNEKYWRCGGVWLWKDEG